MMLVRWPVLIAAAAIAVSGFTTAAVYARVTGGLGLPATFIGVMAAGQGAGSILGGLVAGRLIAWRGPLAAGGTGAVIFAGGPLLYSLPWWQTTIAGSYTIGVGLPWTLVAGVPAAPREAGAAPEVGPADGADLLPQRSAATAPDLDGAEIAGIRDRWLASRKPVHLMVAIDESGTMAFDGSVPGRDRMTEVRDALKRAQAWLGRNDEFSVVGFAARSKEHGGTKRPDPVDLTTRAPTSRAYPSVRSASASRPARPRRCSRSCRRPPRRRTLRWTSRHARPSWG